MKNENVIVDARSAEKPTNKTCIYVFDERGKKETIIDNLMNRRNRPHKEYKTHLATVLNKSDIPVSFIKHAQWSQKAGCSCGCSPGFIIKGHVGKEIFVTLK